MYPHTFSNTMLTPNLDRYTAAEMPKRHFVSAHINKGEKFTFTLYEEELNKNNNI